MELLIALAVAFTVWGLTVVGLITLLYLEKIPSEAPNMVFYFILQAAVPMTIFWWLTQHQVAA